MVVEAVCEGKILRVVRDGDVLIPVRFRRLSHFLDRVPAVGLDRVHVHVALQVFGRDQPWKLVLGGKVDLTQVLAHLGRNVIEVELGVDLFFGGACDWLFGFKVGETVLAQRESHLQRALAQRDVMGFRSGEVLHGRAE